MFLVGITGGSGSGKTTFAQKIIQQVADSSVALLHQDSYYLANPPAHIRVHGEPNFDHPESFDWPLLRSHLELLKSGKRVNIPVYDYKTNERAEETTAVGPCRVILMEGIYTLWDPQMRDLFDLKVFLHVDSDIRFIRRLHRDVRERARTLDSIIRQYYDTVRPMHHEYLEPQRQFADIAVGEETDVAAGVLAARIREMLLRESQ